MKNFDEWNEEKKKVNNREINFYFHEREIRWCTQGVNVGHESDGKGSTFSRPVLILKKINKNTCLVAPITTTSIKRPYLFDFYIGSVVNKVNITQIKVISTRRLDNLICKINKDLFNKIKQKIKAQLL